MKTKPILIILLNLYALSNLFSQSNAALSAGNDKLLRAAMASYSESQFNLNFQTTYAQAYANIILKAHRDMIPYPPMSISSKIPADDKNKLEELIRKLKVLRENPPAWENILLEEEKKIAVEAGPPSAPVFVGNENPKAKEMHKKYATRYSSSNGSEKFIEQNTQQQDLINNKK